MRLLIALILIVLPITGAAQEPDPWHVGYEHFDTRVQVGAASPSQMLGHHPAAVEDQVTVAAQDIVDHTGLRLNFAPAPAHVPNAMAYMGANGVRLLLYNPQFMTKVHDRINPDWGIISILSHEIGHHLQGHIFQNDAGFHQRELEADEFTGFVLYRMGATLREAQSATSALAQDFDVSTHPRRATRLTAIERGWNRAQAVALHEALLSQRRHAQGENSPPKP